MTTNSEAPYFVISPSGTRYGPANEADIRRWLQEGTVTLESQVLDSRTSKTQRVVDIVGSAHVPTHRPGPPKQQRSQPRPSQRMDTPRTSAPPRANKARQGVHWAAVAIPVCCLFIGGFAWWASTNHSAVAVTTPTDSQSAPPPDQIKLESVVQKVDGEGQPVNEEKGTLESRAADADGALRLMVSLSAPKGSRIEMPSSGDASSFVDSADGDATARAWTPDGRKAVQGNGHDVDFYIRLVPNERVGTHTVTLKFRAKVTTDGQTQSVLSFHEHHPKWDVSPPVVHGRPPEPKTPFAPKPERAPTGIGFAQSG